MSGMLDHAKIAERHYEICGAYYCGEKCRLPLAHHGGERHAYEPVCWECGQDWPCDAHVLLTENATFADERSLLESMALIDSGMAVLSWIASNSEGVTLPLIAAAVELADWIAIGRLMGAGLLSDVADTVYATERGKEVAGELIRIRASLMMAEPDAEASGTIALREQPGAWDDQSAAEDQEDQ